jgi:hypothetical protein
MSNQHARRVVSSASTPLQREPPRLWADLPPETKAQMGQAFARLLRHLMTPGQATKEKRRDTHVHRR